MTGLRAGLIGLGMMGRHHARVLAELPGVDLVAVADCHGDPHQVAQGRPVLADVDELVAVGVDYCVVAVPTAHHEEVGLALAEAGVHALIEKPLAPDVPSARKLAEAFAGAGLVGAVGHIERYNPALRAVRRELAGGGLGVVHQVVTRRQGPFPGRILDVGVVKDLATHDIDLTAWLVQQPFRTVTAHSAHTTGRDHEDLLAAVGTLADGTVTSHLVNWLSPFRERVTVVTGERGTLVADTLSTTLTAHAHAEAGCPPAGWAAWAATAGGAVGLPVGPANPLRLEHEAFRDALLGRPADIVTMAEGLRTVIVAEGMIESAQSGGTVRLEGVL